MKWIFLLILGVVCISTSAILVTVAGTSPTTAALYRNLFAALIWLILWRYSTPFRPCSRKDTADSMRVAPFLWRFANTYGVAGIFTALGLAFAVDLWAWHRCIALVGAGPATLLGNLQVVFIALLGSLVFGEVLKPYYWIGSSLALLGIGLLTLTRGVSLDVVLGLVMGILTALTYAIFLIFLKLLGHYDLEPAQTLFWVAVSTLVFLAVPFYLEADIRVPDRRTLVVLLIHAFISSVLGWWLIVKALRHIPVAQTATILLLQPLLTSIWGHLFLGQYLDGLQGVGILVALVGIRLANWEGCHAV